MKRRHIIHIILFALAACGHHDHAGHEDHEGHEDHDHAPHAHQPGKENHESEEGLEAEGAHASGVVEMTPEAVKSAGIEMLTIVPADFREAVKVPGVIENSRGAERVIAAPASGIVSFAAGIVDGHQVAAGQPLFSISSKGLEQADPVAAINVDVAAARKALERAESLIKDNLITRTEYDRLRAEYDRALAAQSSMAARTARAVSVAAPIAGYLVNVAVAPGAFVNMGDPIATVAADRRLLLRADVSERNRKLAHSVSGANIRVPGADNSIALQTLSPRVLAAASAPAANSHFFPVYIEFDNPGGIGAGSVVETWLLGPLRENVLTVPNSALVEEGGYFYVYVQMPDEHPLFRKTEVTRGNSDGIRTEITSGINSGDIIVSKGAPRIRMAGMSSSIHGHSHHH